MVKLSFMGGTHEVGRNAVLVASDEAKLLLEYGVKIGEPTEFPAHVGERTRWNNHRPRPPRS